LKSIQNTKKITDSMKLIAANKIENAEKSLKTARQIGNSFNGKIFKNQNQILIIFKWMNIFKLNNKLFIKKKNH